MNQDRPRPPDEHAESEKNLTGRQAYNLVTDTVGGTPNFRLWDNLIQLFAVLFSTGLGVLIGYLTASDARTGMVLGGVVGLLAGTLTSGFALMIFRLVRHGQGKHD